MSFYSDASLVMIPSGYKTSKVYSAVPTDGAGDLSFSRSNDTATRVNSAGLIEKVRTNLILQSQDFTTSWATNASPTITANTTVAPDGTTTADTIASSGASSGVYQIPTVVSGVEYSFSVYVKNITSATSIQIGCDLNPSNGNLYFNAVTGAITFISAGITGSSVTSVGNGWYRVSGTYNSTGTTNTFIVFGQTGMSFAVWGAQLETGVTTAYIATTSAAVSVGPVANVPRLDYLNSSCPRLLLEPQRVNKWYFSESFDNAEWLKSNVTISANSAVSPDGYTNADKMVDTTANDEHRIRATTALFSITTATTFSIFAKAAEYSKFAIANLSASTYVKFDLSAGTVISTGANFSNAKIENYGNGWYRLSATTSTNGTHGYGLLNDAGDFVFTGTGTKGVFIYGAQAEEAAYATSYIGPTLGAAVTRGADACSKTSISSLIGQTEGTLFADITIPTMANTGANLVSISLFNAGLTNRTLFDIYDSGDLFAIHVNGTAQASIQKTGFTAGRHKVAFGYKANDFVLYVDGTLVGTDTSGTVGAQDSFGLQYGTSQFIGQQYVSQALVFKTRLSNSSLAELTSL